MNHLNIMAFFRDIISSGQNCEEAAIQFSKKLNLKVTETTIKKEILERPDYPSILSISDELKGYGVDNLSLKTTFDNFATLPLPLIA